MDDTTKTNPYEPSDSLVEPEPVPSRVIHGPLNLSIGWTLVLLCNLIVPMLLGWQMTTVFGHLGMLLAILMALLMGYWASVHMPLAVLFTTRGGILLALSQVMPVPHMIAGLISITFFRKTNIIPGEAMDRDGIGFWGAFLLTASTGTILFAFAFGLGLLMRLVTPDRWWLAKKPKED
jgi:hypothetical protein